MAIQVKCETCGTQLDVPWESAGQTVECRKCRGLVTVPELSKEEQTEGAPLRVVVVNSAPLQVATRSNRVTVIVSGFDIPFSQVWKLISQVWLVFFVWTLFIAVISFLISLLMGK